MQRYRPEPHTTASYYIQQNVLSGVMSANIIEWVEILRPMEAHQAAEEIIGATDEKFDRDWRQANTELLAKALIAWAMLAKAENP